MTWLATTRLRRAEDGKWVPCNPTAMLLSAPFEQLVTLPPPPPPRDLGRQHSDRRSWEGRGSNPFVISARVGKSPGKAELAAPVLRRRPGWHRIWPRSIRGFTERLITR